MNNSLNENNSYQVTIITINLYSVITLEYSMNMNLMEKLILPYDNAYTMVRNGFSYNIRR
jgi:hypothetical protein